MKALLNLCAICLIVTIVGCKSDDAADASMNVSPGAISECGVNCECCPGSENYKGDDASLGAVDDASKCSGAATDCSGAPKTCDSDKSDASLGAVSETKSCSGETKSSCDSDKSDASLGAVSEKPSHCSGSGPCPAKSDG